tara:strand:- start:7636 stop:8202 length:567 start_codon:yes stop_codon:yes gene_type:complete
MVTRPWSIDEDDTIRANRAAGIEDAVTAEQIGRTLGAVGKRAQKLKVSTRFVQPIANDDALFNYLKQAAIEGRPCPGSEEIEEKLGITSHVSTNGVKRLARSGRIIIHRFGSNRRKVEIPGVGATGFTQPRRLSRPDYEWQFESPIREKPGASAIWAGMRFDSADVQSDPRRAPLYLTQVATQVDGAW